VDFRDLVQLGIVGLLEAMSRFDIDRAAGFKAFASKRIRGAILSGLQQNSELHAQGAFRNRIRRERARSLHQEAGTTSRGDEFQRMVDVALGLAVGHMLEGTSMFVTAEGTGGPASAGEFQALSESLRDMVDTLPEPERHIVRHHYFEGLPFKVIADLLQLSPGRISQLHSRGLQTLRERQRKKGRLDIEI
jgi:RNA polymerase sigma factor for flagellar operon FliA